MPLFKALSRRHQETPSRARDIAGPAASPHRARRADQPSQRAASKDLGPGHHQAPMGNPGADTLPACSPPKPLATRMSLWHWANEPHISMQDKSDREVVLGGLETIATFAPRARSMNFFKRIRNAPDLELRFEGDFVATLTRLSSLPSGMHITGNLILTNCANLSALGSDLRVDGRLSLVGCTALKTLSTNLVVGGDLIASGCTALNSIGEGLFVAGSFDLEGCTALRALPEHNFVGGGLNLRNCAQITALPRAMLSWGPNSDGTPRAVNLAQTGLGEQLVARLRVTKGQQWLIEAGARPVHAALMHNEVQTQLLQLFDHLPHARTLLQWPPSEAPSIANYLARIFDTADYKNITTRPALLTRLDALLQVTERDPAMRTLTASILEDALEGCGDRILWALNSLEIHFAVHAAKQRPKAEYAQALQKLGLSLMRLSIVHEHGARSVATEPLADDVEIYLAYEIKLHEVLGLPGKTRSSLYTSGIPEAHFEAAAQDALKRSADVIEVAHFFAQWSPWQEHLRHNHAERVTYLGLDTVQPAFVKNFGATGVCMFTQEPASSLSEPVYLGEGTTMQVYEFAPLKSWWVEHGTDPINHEVFHLENLRRHQASQFPTS